MATKDEEKWNNIDEQKGSGDAIVFAEQNGGTSEPVYNGMPATGVAEGAAPAPLGSVMKNPQYMYVDGTEIDNGDAIGSPDKPSALNNDVEHKQEAEKAEAQKSAYDELFEQRAAADKEYEEKKKKLKRNARTSEIISGIADMAGALGNIYYANKGVPVAFDPTKGMSPRVRERYEKALADMNQDYTQKQHYIDKKISAQQFKDRQAYLDNKLKNDADREERLRQANANSYAIALMKQEAEKGKLDIRKAELDLKKLVNENKMTIEQAKLNLNYLKETNDQAKIKAEQNKVVVTEEEKNGRVSKKTTQKTTYGDENKKPNPMGSGKKSNPMN